MAKTTSVKTLKKWEEEVKSKFSYDLSGGKVSRLRCETCVAWEERISSCKNFSLNWIRPGSESVSKDSVKKHVQSFQHKEAEKLQMKKGLGADAYKRQVVQKTAIGQSFAKISNEDREGLRVKVNTMYHIIKNEDPFTDYPKLLNLQKINKVPILQQGKQARSYATDDYGAIFGDFIGKVTMDSLKKDLAKAHYYSVLCDGSTDKSVIEQEAIFILFLSDGFPALRYLSIESVDHATATGVLSSLTTAFERFGVPSFEKSLLGLNCNGASVNLGQFGGLGALIKEKAPWLELVHCFKHRIKLALKDAFENSTFAKIETMLMKLYYLYQKSPKRYRELKELSGAYEKTITKPTKAHGTRWIDHKYRAMERVLDNYRPYIAHLESLCHTDSQALKRAELVGQAKKWKDATYPMYMAIYLDILSPIRRISVAMQSDFHDPVKVVKRIKEFRWTMAKLVLVLDEALDKEGSALTHFTKLMKEIKVKENGKHEYQGVQLKYYNRSFQSVKDHYLITVSNICECVEQRFESLFDSPDSLVESVLDTCTWPIDGDCGQFGNNEID